MSVREEQYVVYGVKLSVKEYKKRYQTEDNEYDDEPHASFDGYDEETELDVIYDGMSGNYVVIGKVLVYADSYDGDSMSFTKLNMTTKEKKAVAKELEKYFGITIEDQKDEDMKPEYMAFTHYS